MYASLSFLQSWARIPLFVFSISGCFWHAGLRECKFFKDRRNAKHKEIGTLISRSFPPPINPQFKDNYSVISVSADYLEIPVISAPCTDILCTGDGMVCVRVLLAMWQVRSSRNLPPESVPCYTVRGRGHGQCTSPAGHVASLVILAFAA